MRQTHYQFYVELFQRDVTVAGTFGDVEWDDDTSCYILTDDPDGLIARLESDENVLSFLEVDDEAAS